MKLGNFSYLTLLPSDPEEKKLHWQYKLRGIRKTMYFYGIGLSAVLLFSVIIFIFGRTMNLFMIVVCAMLASVLFGLIYMLSKNSDRFVYFIPVFRLIVHFVFIYSTRGFLVGGA